MDLLSSEKNSDFFLCVKIIQDIMNYFRAVRAMNESLKQNRILRERGDDRSFANSLDDKDNGPDLQKNVCFSCNYKTTLQYWVLSSELHKTCSMQHSSCGSYVYADLCLCILHPLSTLQFGLVIITLFSKTTLLNLCLIWNLR